MALDQPEMRGEKIYQPSHKPRTSGRIVLYGAVLYAVLAAEDPRQRPDQTRVPQVAAPGPKWRHCLPKSTWRITSTPTGTHYRHASQPAGASMNCQPNLIFCDPIHQAPVPTYARQRSETESSGDDDPVWVDLWLLPSPSSERFACLLRLFGA